MHKIHCARTISKCKHCGRAMSSREVEGHVAASRGTASGLVAAIAAGDVPAIETMLQHGASSTVPCDGTSGDTPLHIAARYRRVGVLDYLLSRGASINAGNAAGETALHVACASRDDVVHAAAATAAAAAAAAAAGAGGGPADARASPVPVVCAADDLADLVAFLVRRGCDVEARTVLGDTPMQVAQRAKNLDVLLLLSSSGAGLRPVRVCPSSVSPHSALPLLRQSPQCSSPRALSPSLPRPHSFRARS
jgi:hypothetical protein